MTRLRAHTEGIKHEDRIINTLIKMKLSGLSEHTLKTVSQKLNQLGRNSDLMNPRDVEAFIANRTATNATKQKLVNCYQYLCRPTKSNGKHALTKLPYNHQKCLTQIT